MARTRGLVGRPTRGKTAPERLRRTDVLASLLRLPPRAAPLVVDLGYGADAVTTIETANRLRRDRPEVRVVGVEIDRERVEAALPFARAGVVEFRHGGFELPLRPDERPGLVRAMNVLRQYPEGEYDAAIGLVCARLAPGGVLVEGTSSPTGRLLTANLWRRPEQATDSDSLVHDGVVLSVNLRRPWEPRELQTVLPKNWIHRVEPGSSLDDWFARWERAVTVARSARTTPRGVFVRAAHTVRELGGDVDLRPALLERGFLIARWT